MLHYQSVLASVEKKQRKDNLSRIVEQCIYASCQPPVEFLCLISQFIYIMLGILVL